MNNPITDIVTETKAKLSGRLDLRDFQTRLLAEQRKHRASIAKAKRFKTLRRQKVKQQPIADCTVIDTRTDQARSRLYYELSNGQVVRADRAADRGVRFHPDIANAKPNERLMTVLKGRRKAPFKNRLIRTKVTEETLKNANRG
jgi:hypothetical protein